MKCFKKSVHQHPALLSTEEDVYEVFLLVFLKNNMQFSCAEKAWLKAIANYLLGGVSVLHWLFC